MAAQRGCGGSSAAGAPQLVFAMPAVQPGHSLGTESMSLAGTDSVMSFPDITSLWVINLSQPSQGCRAGPCSSQGCTQGLPAGAVLLQLSGEGTKRNSGCQDFPKTD